MNKCWYCYGDGFKVKFRNHYCYKCGEKLIIVKHQKIVDRKSEEAKYYEFDTVGDGVTFGPCKFIHKVFFCPQCSQNIEFITQINQEDIEIIIQKVRNHFKKRNREIFISKSYKTKSGELIENDFSLSDNVILCLHISEKNKELKTNEIPISREKYWERPYYFDISKKSLIRFIESPDTYCEWKVKTKNKRKKIYKCLGIINLCLPFILIACVMASTFIFGKQCSIEGNWFFLVATLPWLIAFMFFDMGRD
ncbi:MAG: hypothetical protein E7617_06790 [Ruminococcaceae bacterium]|nr:hypothetical protein [Oscillospiraceae bacterium]